MGIAVYDNPRRHRYEVTEDDTGVGFVTYRLQPGLIDFIHAEVDQAHAGRGLAAQLVGYALDDARRRGLHVLPHCPYVRSFIGERLDEYLDLVPVDRRAEFGWGPAGE